MSFSISATEHFDKQVKKLAKKYPSMKQDLIQLKEELLENPLQGTPLGKDCYKIRMAIKSKNQGKSGGARVITCLKIVDETIYLLSIYDKSEKEDLEEKELDNLLKIAGI
jgi:mRNA-degrading endonuclease RelE of RelBE toxin-antitoxin system